MLRIDIGREPAEYCDGMSRRSFVQIGIAGMASIGLGDVLRAKALSGQAQKNRMYNACLLGMPIWSQERNLLVSRTHAPYQ